MTKRILITGASGLMGRVLTEHLCKNSSYDVYGIDKHTELSVRYKYEDMLLPTETKLILPMNEKFFICDITDRDRLERIIHDNKINIIIHLAATIIMDSIADIEHINFHGTQLVFDIAAKQDHVELMIYASSLRTVFGYLEMEPYSSLPKNIKPQEPLRKVTINDPTLLAHDDPPVAAYCRGKVYGEELARQYSLLDTNHLTFVCARFGWINTGNNVTSSLYNWSDKSVWCSHGDLCQFIDRVLENYGKLKRFQIYFVSSNNDFCWVDMENSKEDLNFKPVDGAKWD